METKPKLATVTVADVMLPDVLGPEDVARWIGCTRATAIRHMRTGRIKGTRIGRRWVVTRTEFLAALRPDAPPPPLRIVGAA